MCDNNDIQKILNEIVTELGSLKLIIQQQQVILNVMNANIAQQHTAGIKTANKVEIKYDQCKSESSPDSCNSTPSKKKGSVDSSLTNSMEFFKSYIFEKNYMDLRKNYCTDEEVKQYASDNSKTFKKKVEGSNEYWRAVGAIVWKKMSQDAKTEITNMMGKCKNALHEPINNMLNEDSIQNENSE